MFPIATASFSKKPEPLAQKESHQAKVIFPKIDFSEVSQKLKQVLEQVRKQAKKKAKKPVVSGTSTIRPAVQDLTAEVQKYDWDWQKALRIINCESGGNPNSISGNGLYHGLAQFQKSTWISNAPPEYKDFSYVYNPQIHILVFYRTYKSNQGWGSWPVCQYK